MNWERSHGRALPIGLHRARRILSSFQAINWRRILFYQIERHKQIQAEQRGPRICNLKLSIVSMLHFKFMRLLSSIKLDILGHKVTEFLTSYAHREKYRILQSWLHIPPNRGHAYTSVHLEETQTGPYTYIVFF